MAEHGGALIAAARRYGIPPEQWLDLSTGINPNGWPVPHIPDRVWNRLPERNDDLLSAAAEYYGSEHAPLLLSGSQAAIQGLPQLRSPCRVGIVAPTYFEHEQGWRRAGHAISLLAPSAVERALDRLDVLVLANPNNPTAARYAPALLLHWHERLAERGGWLLVDEAFVDATPELSIVACTGRPGLLVLRSLGKFFGLAGARVGFLFAWPALLGRLESALGPWPVSGPSCLVAAGALRDYAWQSQTRERLRRDGARLNDLLTACGLTPSGASALFAWCVDDRAPHLHEKLARRGILTRLFESPPSLRFGLPTSEADWLRLNAVLMEIVRDSDLSLIRG